MISLVCLKWIHPPGPANVPTWAWLLIVLGRLFFRLGGTGDLRAFQTALRGSMILAVCAVLLILTTPFLTNYAIMNLALFLLLFTIGFLTARIAGITFWMEFAFLTISEFVALNPRSAGCSADPNGRVFGGRKSKAYRSGSRAANVASSNHPVGFSPKCFARNHGSSIAASF